MFALLRQRSFALLWTGGLISILGDRVLMTALPFYVYQQSGSTLATALMVAARLLPHFVLGSVAGVYADRWDRKKIMVAASLAQAGVLLPLIWVSGGADLWIIYAISFLQTSLAIFFAPAETALLPKLVGEEHLLQANALNALNNQIARLIGPPLGGVLLALWGLPGVVLFDSLTFVIAGLMILSIQAPGQAAAPKPEAPVRAGPGWRQFRAEWLEGLNIIRQDRFVTWLFISVVLLNFGGTLIDPLWAPYMVNVVKANSQTYGLVMTIQAAGGILGGLLAGKIAQRFAPVLIYGWGEILLALVLFVRYNIPDLPVVYVTAFLTGVPAAIGIAALETLFQQAVPNSHLGRISGMLNTTRSVVALFGVLGIAGTLGDLLGIVPVLNLAASATLLTGLLVLRFLAARRYAAAPALAGSPDESG